MHDDIIIVRQADHNNIQSDPDDAPNEPHYPIALVIQIILMTMTMMILKMLITNPDGKSELSQPGHAGGEADQVEAALLSHRDLAVLQRV